jgi:hypothetical protein
MGRSRALATRERDAHAVELRRRGLTYGQIAKELGFRAQSGAFDAVRRGIRDTYREDTEGATSLELERLDEMARTLYRVLATRHYAVSKDGTVVVNPVTKEPLVDDGPVLEAVEGLRKVSESRRKLLGLDAPTRTRVEVVTEEAVDAEIERLTRILAGTSHGGLGLPPVPGHGHRLIQGVAEDAGPRAALPGPG